jgi:hypothetical protein
MVVISILPHAEFGRNDHREDAPHFTNFLDGENITGNESASRTGRPRLVLIDEFLLSCEG